MTTRHPTQPTGDRTKNALAELTCLLEKEPHKNRQVLLQQVEAKFDLTPKECEFLNRNFH